MTSKIISIVSVKAVMIAALFTGTAATSSDAHAGRYHHSDGGYYHHGGYYRGHRHAQGRSIQLVKCAIKHPTVILKLIG